MTVYRCITLQGISPPDSLLKKAATPLPPARAVPANAMPKKTSSGKPVGPVDTSESDAKVTLTGRSAVENALVSDRQDFFSGLPTQVFPASSAAEVELSSALSATPPLLSPRPKGNQDVPEAQPDETATPLAFRQMTFIATKDPPPQNMSPRAEKGQAVVLSDPDQPRPETSKLTSAAATPVTASEAQSVASAPPSAPTASPYINTVMRRITSVRRWQDIASLVEQQPQRLDAVAVAAALVRLSELVPPGGLSQLRRIDGTTGMLEDTPASLGVSELSTELMSLLQLQLPRLPAASLAAALGAAGKLEARPPRAAWLGSALGAVQSKMSR